MSLSTEATIPPAESADVWMRLDAMQVDPTIRGARAPSDPFNPEPLPRRGELSHIAIYVTSNDGEAPIELPPSISWYLTADAAGRIPITPRTDSTMVQTGNYGGIADALEVAYALEPGAAGVFVWINGSAPGLRMRARVVWRVVDPADWTPELCARQA